MILTADVRNGGVSVGLVSAEGQWQAIVRLSAVDRSADEWAFLIRSLFAERGMGLQDLSQAVLSSVVPAWTGIFVDVLEGFLPRGASCLVVGPGIKTGLRIRTDNPAEVGSDLVCNAVAASALVPVPCIIIDFSTTLSFTALDRQGDLVGVALVPGLEAAASDLRLRAAQIPQVKLEAPERALGKNTAESIRSGIMLGWAGLTDRLIEEISREIASPGTQPSLVGTGWYDQAPVRTRQPLTLWESNLAMQGLYRIAMKNRG